MSYISARSLSRLSMSIAANQLVMSVKAPFRQWFPDPSTAGSNVEKLVSAASWTINGDGHASENFKMGLWGVTHFAAGDNWNQDTMACVHLGVSTAGVVFPCIARKWLNVSPANTAIGSLSAAPSGASSQGNAFVPLALALDADKTPYAGVPLIPYGSFRMRKNQADATHWALPTALTLGSDGWGLFNEKTPWVYPGGQNGNETGKHFVAATGATTLAFSTNAATFVHTLSNMIHFRVEASNCSANGGDASGVTFWMPLAPLALAGAGSYGTWVGQGEYSGNGVSGACTITCNDASGIQFRNSGGSIIADNVFGVSASYRMRCNLSYMAG